MFRRLLALLLLSLVGVLGIGSTSHATAESGVAFTYDAPSIARGDAHASRHVAAGLVQVGVALEVSAWPPARSRGASTTPFRSLNATEAARPVIGFAPGEGVSALTPGRLQHGTAHLSEKGILPAWSGRNSPQLIRDTLSPILENPTATFNNTLGGTQVKGFIGTVNGQTVAVQIYAEGPLAGQLATSVVPTANQLAKWGVAP